MAFVTRGLVSGRIVVHVAFVTRGLVPGRIVVHVTFVTRGLVSGVLVPCNLVARGQLIRFSRTLKRRQVHPADRTLTGFLGDHVRVHAARPQLDLCRFAALGRARRLGVAATGEQRGRRGGQQQDDQRLRHPAVYLSDDSHDSPPLATGAILRRPVPADSGTCGSLPFPPRTQAGYAAPCAPRRADRESPSAPSGRRPASPARCFPPER